MLLGQPPTFCSPTLVRILLARSLISLFMTSISDVPGPYITTAAYSPLGSVCPPTLALLHGELSTLPVATILRTYDLSGEAALRSIPEDKLRARFDPVAFTRAEIYPTSKRGGWDSKALEPLLFTYRQVVAFFREAAQDGDIVLLSFD